MLILERKVGEAVVIPTTAGPIVIKLTRTERGKAWLGFEAPRQFAIHRQEIQCIDGAELPQPKNGLLA